VKGYTVEEPTTLIWFVAAWASDENKTTAQINCTSFFILFPFWFVLLFSLVIKRYYLNTHILK
jgi:hypothetical protein